MLKGNRNQSEKLEQCEKKKKEKNKTGMGGRVAVLNRLAGGKLLFELKS